jgi:N-acetylglutamate synthase-like GNAT family acetyltransferase
MTPRTLSLGPASLHIGEADIGLNPALAASLREVTAVNVPEADRRKGWGTALMNYLTTAADRHAVALMLEVKSEGDMTDDQLEAFYAKHGFERFQSSPCVLMVRVPRQ